MLWLPDPIGAIVAASAVAILAVTGWPFPDAGQWAADEFVIARVRWFEPFVKA